MADPSPPYIYRGLNSEGETRLVQLLPGLLWTDIHVRIEHCILKDQDVLDSYEALSYVCGTPKQTQPIWIDGKQLQVTVNLWYALQRLRHEDESQLLWIDQISINQEDAKERTQQVSLMGSIFASASVVVAWLGEDATHDGGTALEFLRLLFKTYYEFPSKKIFLKHKYGSSCGDELENIHYTKTEGLL